jgi:two-component system chemotaxis response regulator CheB
MAITRVLVVEDSLTMRKYLVDVLASNPEFAVVGEARDGAQAIELCRALRPDVVTLDIMLPVMSGVAVTEYIMAYCPTPILIVSASTNRGELYQTYEALSAGAVDVLEKPGINDTGSQWDRNFVSAVKMVSKIRVITHVRAKLGGSPQTLARGAGLGTRSGVPRRKIVAIGGSTGGPAAVVDILRGLPSGFEIPILLVIHLGAPFGAAFTEWLDEQSGLRVRYARDREALPTFGQPGVIMAPPGLHLVVEDGRLRLTSDAERNSCRPSIDVLFESLAKQLGRETIACLLTGMGKDGARGLLALRHAGAFTIAQDETSSVVFGMPREAIEIGAADRVVSLHEIAPAVAAAGALQN